MAGSFSPISQNILNPSHFSQDDPRFEYTCFLKAEHKVKRNARLGVVNKIYLNLRFQGLCFQRIVHKNEWPAWGTDVCVRDGSANFRDLQMINWLEGMDYKNLFKKNLQLFNDAFWFCLRYSSHSRFITSLVELVIKIQVGSLKTATPSLDQPAFINRSPQTLFDKNKI